MAGVVASDRDRLRSAQAVVVVRGERLRSGRSETLPSSLRNDESGTSKHQEEPADHAHDDGRWKPWPLPPPWPGDTEGSSKQEWQAGDQEWRQGEGRGHRERRRRPLSQILRPPGRDPSDHEGTQDPEDEDREGPMRPLERSRAWRRVILVTRLVRTVAHGGAPHVGASATPMIVISSGCTKSRDRQRRVVAHPALRFVVAAASG